MDKFKFYYEPKGEFDIKSFTISIEEDENKRYKVKVLKEIFENGEVRKIKIKEVYDEIEKILEKINSIDFDKERNKNGENPVVVKYGEKRIETNSLDEISDICDLFKVNELLSNYIEEIDNIKEFLES